MFKKLFLISSFCDSEEKLKILYENLKIIKNMGHESLLLSPIDLPEKIIRLCDFYFQTKENPVSTIEEKTYIHWNQINDNYRLERFFPDYGWAALYQNKKLSQIGITLDYDIYYHIIYDTKFNEGLIKQINSNVVNEYYSNLSTNGDINEFSLHFIPLNKELLVSFEQFLNKSEYNKTHDLIHDYMLKWVNKERINKNNFIIEEHINFYNSINFFSIYDGPEVNIFFERFELNQQTNKILCYDIKTDDIKIIINDNIVFNNFSEKEPLDTNMFTSEINKIIVSINGIDYDCTDNYSKIGRTKIFYL
jgi:hypothetical protein